jgi:hypothetical protein
MTALFASAFDWVGRLHAQGIPLSGSVRALAYQYNGPWQYEILPWTAGFALGTLEYDWEAMFTQRGQGHLVTDADAVLLRQWRNNQDADAYHPPFAGNPWMIPVSENGGPLFALFVRDVFPFENENGLIPFGPYAPPSDGSGGDY